MLKKFYLVGFVLSFLTSQQLFAFVISDIKVIGNSKVETRAILGTIQSKAGTTLNKNVLSQDIKKLYELGLFSNIEAFQDGRKLVFKVVEKPAVIAIDFSGFKELEADDLKKKLQTEVYRIVDRKVLATDMRMIELEYAKKGFFLARVRYDLEPAGENKVKVKFSAVEGGKVQVASVEIHGNKAFSDGRLVEGFLTRPVTRISKLSSRSNYQDAVIQRDNEYLALFYKNHGYAKVQVGKPSVTLDGNKKFVHVTFAVEEGKKYKIGNITYSGDQLISEEKIKKDRNLDPGDVFQYNKFSSDIESLVDSYGDLGFAFTDIAPIPSFNEENQTVDIDIRVTKGRKVYIGEITIVGNTKTRDNVIRRELTLAEGDLFSGTKLSDAKKEIERLGFFEEVQVVKERSKSSKESLDLKVRVKEKPTGQLQAALGFTPSNNTDESRFFGQGRYEEKNQSGMGIKTNFAGRWNRGDNYSLSAEIWDPRFRDSDWSLGCKVFFENQVSPLLGIPTGTLNTSTNQVDVSEKKIGGSVSVGRKIIEKVRASLTYRLEDVETKAPFALSQGLLKQGLSSSLTLTLGRNATNNYLDPSAGSDISLSQKMSGGLLGGIDPFAETSLDAVQFFPIQFTETYRTYFKLHANVSFLYKTKSSSPVPLYERYRLGGFENLRGYPFQTVGPLENRAIGTNPNALYNRGGNKKMVFQLEYFFPLIPEAGLKAVLFGDIGKSFDDHEKLSFKGLSKNVGFGFRWATPIAPFRFEWAYPVVGGKLAKKPEFIFFLGY